MKTYLKNTIKRLIKFILSYKENSLIRKTILIFIDFFSLIISFNFTLFINSYSIYSYSFSSIFIYYSLFLSFNLFIYYFTGQYNNLTRYLGKIDIYKICLRNVFIISFTVFLDSLLNFKTFNLKNIIILWILLTNLNTFSRILLRDVLRILNSKFSAKSENVVIYGTSSTGFQLAKYIENDSYFNLLYFIDENKKLVGKSINGKPIRSVDFLLKDIDKVDKVLVIKNSLKLKNFKVLLEKLSQIKIPVLSIPKVNDLINGNVHFDNLKSISIDDLLSRDSFTPDLSNCAKDIKSQNILVTGAGGSIGAEISRQLIKLQPKRIIILDQNEFSLYKIEKELSNLCFEENIELITSLSDATEYKLLEKILLTYDCQIIFHAAAYKHVPLVQKNTIQAIKNNIFSTWFICQLAESLNIKKVIIISSDKAVRPTNIMGVTKRISELIAQGFANKIESKNISNSKEKSNLTIFTIVRFGNVLGSSGSVVPLFRNQIEMGGPITLTHKNVIRYFMTIPEAVNLVIHASHLSKGGELFLLDMGKPVKIYDLAVQMIKLSGLTLKDKNNPDGDIEIVLTGLRPGEKLYEELLIEKDAEKTSHSLIYSAKEKYIQPEFLFPQVNKLFKAVEELNINAIIEIIKTLVPEWKEDNKFS